MRIAFTNTGTTGAVFPVYDRKNLTAIPRRYTVTPGESLSDAWETQANGDYDLWLLGPNGFHRHFTGNARSVLGVAQSTPELSIAYLPATSHLVVTLRNTGPHHCQLRLVANKYYGNATRNILLQAHAEKTVYLALQDSAHWYDFSVHVRGEPAFSRRFAGHMETGADSYSDPAFGGSAIADQYQVAG